MTAPGTTPAVRGGVRAADAMLLTCVLLWSGNFTALAYGLEAFSPIVHAAVRFVLGGALFAVWVLWREGSLRVARRDVLGVLGLAAVGIFANQLAVVYAVRETGGAHVAMLMGIAPVFAAALAVTLGHERLTPAHWIGVAFAFVGAGLVIQGGQGDALAAGSLVGGALGVATAVTWGAYSVFVRPLMERYSAERLSALVVGSGGLMLAVVALPQAGDQDWSAPSTGQWAALGYSLVLALVITNALWFEGIKRVGASRATLFMYVQPFAGALIALVLLDEPVTALQWAGGAVILVGVVLARSRPARQAVRLRAAAARLRP